MSDGTTPASTPLVPLQIGEDVQNGKTHALFECPCGNVNIKNYTLKDAEGGATTECDHCGMYLIYVDNEVTGAVELFEFNLYLNSRDSRWPCDGKGTGYIEF